MTNDDQMPDDETIAAWLDGSLDAEGTQRMTDLAARNETFARRVERLRHIDDLVRMAVPAEEALPDALLERLGLAPVAGGTVVNLAAVRAARAEITPPARFGGSFLRMAAQLALVAGLGLAVLVVVRPGDRTDDPAASYRALGSAPAASAHMVNALVKFAPEIGAAEAGRIAGSAGLKLVGAPNAAGAWKAAVEPGRRTGALGALRADPRVVMAEPIDGATP